MPVQTKKPPHMGRKSRGATQIGAQGGARFRGNGASVIAYCPQRFGEAAGG